MIVAARGLGSQQTAQVGVQAGSAALSTTAAALVAAHLIPLSAVPFVGPALMGVTLVASLLIKNSGCGQTCIVTSQWADQAANALKQNLDAYFAEPVRTAASQKLALQNFDAIWARLQEMCGDPSTGDAGKRCISDRERGACKWKDQGACWNWFIGYRDPIANDKGVVPDSSLPGGSISFGGSEVPILPLALIAGLVLLGVSL